MDVEQSRLQRIYAELRRMEDHCARLAGEVRDAERRMDAAAAQGNEIDATALRALDEYRLYAQRERELLERERGTIERRIVEQRERLTAARRDFELLDRLKLRARARSSATLNLRWRTPKMASSVSAASSKISRRSREPCPTRGAPSMSKRCSSRRSSWRGTSFVIACA